MDFRARGGEEPTGLSQKELIRKKIKTISDTQRKRNEKSAIAMELTSHRYRHSPT